MLLAVGRFHGSKDAERIRAAEREFASAAYPSSETQICTTGGLITADVDRRSGRASRHAQSSWVARVRQCHRSVDELELVRQVDLGHDVLLRHLPCIPERQEHVDEFPR